MTDANEEVRSQTRLDGENAVSMSIRKQAGTNTVTVVDRVLARLERIQATLPADISVKPTRDQSRFIRKSFEEIQLHLLLGGFLAAAVVFLFIRNWRVTIIAGLAIPTSIIGTFLVMRALDFTLNNMTMLALSLATGIVIDDAIVVLENIFRYIEEKGATPRQAAIDATAEIGLAVMATTLSLVVIFVPVAFMTGQVGRYFYSFGITSATAIMLSMFVSFTLTPALCAYWLRAEDAKAGHAKTQGSRRSTPGWTGSTAGMLEWSLAHRPLMLGIAGAVVVSAAFLYPYVGKELVPDDDQSEFSVNLRLPRGTSYDRTLEYMTPIEGELRKALGTNVAAMMTSIQNGSGNYSVQLTPIEERTQSQQELMQVARRALSKYQNARISVSGGTDISGASTGGGGGGRGGGGGGGGGSTNRLNMIVQGPGHRSAADVRRGPAGQGPRDRRRHRRRHELRGDPARAAHHRRSPARGRPRRVARHALVDDEHADRRRGSLEVQGRRRAVQRPDAPRRAVPQQPRGDGGHLRPRGRRADGARQRRRRTSRSAARRARSIATTGCARSRSTPTSIA